MGEGDLAVALEEDLDLQDLSQEVEDLDPGGLHLVDGTQAGGLLCHPQG